MKLLLIAALKNRKHFLLGIITLFSLIFLSVANQLEMVSLGVLAKNGTDFFALFENKDKKESAISPEDIQKKWTQIDQKNEGVITKKSAAMYMVKQKNGKFLDRFLSKVIVKLNIEQNFASLIIMLVFVAIFKAIFLFTSRFSTNILSIRVTRDLRQQYFEHIQSLPLSFYHKHDLGSLTSRAVGDAGQIASSLNSFLSNYISAPFTIIASLTFCFTVSWKLSLIIFLGLPLVAYPVIHFTRKIKKVSRQMQKNHESFTSVLLDFLGGIHTVKIFAMESFSLKKYREQNDRMAHLESKSAKYSNLTKPVLHTITTTCLAMVILIGLYLLNMSIAELIIYSGSLYLFYEPVKKFAEENANIQRGVVAAERMFEVLRIESNIQEAKDAVELNTLEDHIEFRNVSFKYRDDWVLKDLSFTVKKGQMVAIVGPTGSGKSTTVQLLPRLYDVQKGSIVIDGIPINQYTINSLRRNISFVPQKPFLFFDTVKENIAYGNGYSDEEITFAARQAHAHEFIKNLPDGYETILTDTGKNLSGGQQQRLTIARALVKKAPILIMDEATSSLDAVSEGYIKKAIEDLQGGVTQIVIAHRLSTIEHADKIIYLEEGRKIAEGTKDELLLSCPSFKNMWEQYHNRKESSAVLV
ncbi:MAG TPA: ABC transporter ATP-binding protein [Chlamydiales bacterium]|nr:ABC transporter ATP-binding protein [Chlamydiales bacterium]